MNSFRLPRLLIACMKSMTGYCWNAAVAPKVPVLSTPRVSMYEASSSEEAFSER